MIANMDKAVKCSRIYTERGLINGMLILNENKIKSILSCNNEINAIEKSGRYEVLDYGGYTIIPGIIDIHSHGFTGYCASTQDINEIKCYTKAIASVGVTGVLPTTNEIGIPYIKQAMEEDRSGARILGIHSEGPFFNPQHMGALAKADGSSSDLPKPTVRYIENMYEKSGGSLRYMTIAVETVEDKNVFRFMREHNIIIAAGHTLATGAQLKEAILHGVQAAVHTGNVMSMIHQRDPGVFGASLLSDTVYNELIADFVHVCKDTIDIMFRIKSPEKFMLISDSSPVSGLKPGTYTFNNRVYISTNDGSVRTPTGRLSGSSSYILKGIRNLVEELHIPMETVLKAAGQNQAQLLGLSNKGSIKEGKDGDFVVINDEYEVFKTFVEGEIVYDQSVSGDERAAVKA